MSEKFSLRELMGTILKEIKAILKEYMNEAETVVKKRLRKLILLSIVSSVLLTLGISLIGSASLFMLIGSLMYLKTFMPAWEAWYIIGITSGITSGILFLGLFIIIRKQLKSPETPAKQN